jgi:hypothetical protein
MELSASEQKTKALHYINEAIDTINNKINDCEVLIKAFKALPPYSLSMQFYQKGMKENEYVTMARKFHPDWDENICHDYYKAVTRWNFNLPKTQAIADGYRAILSSYEEIRKTIADFAGSQEEGVFYSDILSAAQIGLSVEQLSEFIVGSNERHHVKVGAKQ